MRTTILAFIFAASVGPVAAETGPTETEQRQACTGDVFRLCAEHIPDRTAIQGCLASQHDQLSDSCRIIFDASLKAQVSAHIQKP